MKQILFTLLIISCFILSCIDSIDLKLNREVDYLVAEGGIFNGKGPFELKLKQAAAYTKDYGNDYPVEFPYNGAVVKLEDSEGVVGEYFQNQRGVYILKDVDLKIGKKYRISINTKEGDTFKSGFDEIPNPNPILEVNSTFIPNLDTEGGNFKLTTRIKDSKEIGEFYRFSWIGWNSFPLVQINTSNRPLQCLGGYNSSCYFLEKSNAIFIWNDEFQNGNTVDLTSTFIPFNNTEDYLIDIYLHKISKEAYGFWKLVSEQSQKNGTLQDKLPATIYGNILCINNPEKRMLGYFEVSGVRNFKKTISRSVLNEIPFPKTPNQVGCYCSDVKSNLYPNITNQRPEGWF